MTDIPVMARQRALVGTAVLDVLRLYSQAHFGNDRIGENSDEILLGCAIVVAQAKGQPLSATDLAEYLGMPRATVDRKLKKHLAAGRLKSSRDGRRVQYIATHHSDPDVATHIQKIIARLQKVCRELSRLDDSAVAG